MCRHAAYVGPGIALTELMRDLPHSLHHQSYQPRELLTGVVCADGYGVGWYDPDTRPEPARYVNALPIWSDPNLPGFGPLVRSGLVLGAIRNATVEGTTDTVNCAPFADGRWLWSLNGFLGDFDTTWRESVLERIAPGRRSKVRGVTDAEFLFQAFLTRLEQEPDAEAPTVLQALCRELRGEADQNGTVAYLSLLASDGQAVYATRCSNQPEQNSLYHLQDGDEFPGAHVVASEPLYDDPGWQPVDEDTLLMLQEGAPPVRMRI